MPETPERLLLLGGTGDLAARYLFPALGALVRSGHLPQKFSVVGSGSRELSEDGFRRKIAEALDEHAADLDDDTVRQVLAMVTYRQADMHDHDAVAALVEEVPGTGSLVVYLALPPAVYPEALAALARTNLPEGSRLVVEKPFGEDLASARELNRLVHDQFDERSVYRVDHFLAKQTAQNLLGLRFANRLFEPVWTNQHIERVEITFDEALALEGRATYYDGTGALVDMIQNHLLQLLCLVAMDPPTSLEGEDLRDRKVMVLRAIHAMSEDEAAASSCRGRYTAGRVEGREVPSYVDEEGVDPALETETFASVTLSIDSWRWAGVPFVLRTGKALGDDRREIAVHFKAVPHLAFGQRAQPEPNAVCLGLGPDTLTVQLAMNADGDLFDLTPLELQADLAPAGLPAYANVLLHVLEADPTFSIRSDEAEEAWRVVEPVRQAWRAGRVPLVDYEAGSAGPTQPPGRPEN
ncbi:MAG: glucose-6-phosphate dehydrogenase [Actinobacteria bacterium]|nr:glucose-6-phosphate dehydrogenase [Actinomycetota bacterium]